jgi:hypothetical protein
VGTLEGSYRRIRHNRKESLNSFISIILFSFLSKIFRVRRPPSFRFFLAEPFLKSVIKYIFFINRFINII